MLIFLYILCTVAVFLAMTKVYQRFPTPLLLPILSSTIIMILFLVLMHIPYKNYMEGGIWINQLLGPAVVALAFPLYREREMIKAHFIPILGGVLLGTLIAIGGVWGSASFLGIKHSLLLSLLPKSVTSPVAIAISKEIGGLPTLTVTFVMIAGILGALIGPYLFRYLRIHHEIGKGIGYGSASHAIGTSKALEDGHLTGAASSVAMIFSAVLSAILIPLLLML